MVINMFFAENCEVLNDEHGECFHYEVSAMYRTYQGKCSSQILAEHCCRVTKRFSCAVEMEAEEGLN